MKRMQTFFIYFLLFIGLFAVTTLLEGGFIDNMYVKLGSSINNKEYIQGVHTEIEIEDKGSRATNVNGNINLGLKNTMNSDIEKCFLKLDLYNERGLLADTEYIEIADLKSGEERDVKVKFDANNIDRYEVSLIDESQKPDESGTMRILGFDVDIEKILEKFGIDPKNVFGLDLTKLSPKDLAQTAKEKGLYAVRYGINIAKSIPLWAYLIAGGIVLWNLPSGYLFFL